MKKWFILLFVLICGFCFYWFNSKLESVESISKTMDTLDVEDDEFAMEDRVFDVSYESLEEAENKLILMLEEHDPEIEYVWNKELVDFVENDPRTLDYSFDDLQKKGYANVITSDDGNLRFYSWDTQSGGTLIYWGSICQYRFNGEVYVSHECLFDIGNNFVVDKCAATCAIEKIEKVNVLDNDSIYLVFAYTKIGSNCGYYDFIKALKIENGTLIAYPFFIGEEDETCKELGNRCPEMN